MLNKVNRIPVNNGIQSMSNGQHSAILEHFPKHQLKLDEIIINKLRFQ